jgi:hypothetical protein
MFHEISLIMWIYFLTGNRMFIGFVQRRKFANKSHKSSAFAEVGINFIQLTNRLREQDIAPQRLRKENNFLTSLFFLRCESD